jgi:hypothetical protein
MTSRPPSAVKTMQHSQLEDISISEPFDTLHPVSPDWASFASKAGRDYYRNRGTHKTQKLKKRQPVVSILPFVFAVCL